MQCQTLESFADQKTEQYIGLVDDQARLFKAGHVRAGKDLDGLIRVAKWERERALNALVQHQREHVGCLLPYERSPTITTT